MMPSTAAVLVVIITTHIGTIVTAKYRRRPSFVRYADTIDNAIAASIWLAMPNIFQIASKLFALMKYAQPATITIVLPIAPGHQLDCPSFGWTYLPTASCSTNLPMRVPASIVVRMNNASNMIAKWYQYFQSFCTASSLAL